MKKQRDYSTLLKQYFLIFDEGFPTYLAPSDEEEQMDIMEKCLEEKKPYDPYASGEILPDADY